MAIYVSDLELASYPLLKTKNNTLNNSGTLFLHDNKVYKMFEKDFIERFIYLQNIPNHPHVLPIIDEVIPEWESDYQSGYITEYKENAQTWFECFDTNLEFLQKEKYIKQIFSALKHLHQFIVIGDIHGDNFFIHEGNAYIYDLDYFHKLNERPKTFKSKYYISRKERKRPSIVTDVIKTYIESYSFILEIDLSLYIRLLA